MRTERSFSEILAELKEPAPDFSSGWESHLDPFGMAQLIAEVRIAPQYKVSVHKKYPKPPTPKAVIRKSHVFTDEQSRALQVLMIYTQTLRDNFNLHELKSAYRGAVLKTHPDQGGNSETFQEVKKSYQILLGLVKK